MPDTPLDPKEHPPTDRRALLAGLGGLAAGTFLTAGRAEAGPLNPPAAPASTPGPEPRIPINAQNTPGDSHHLFVISQPGSYYLTGDVTGEIYKVGILIIVDGVTIDLMGFSLRGGLSTLAGISTNALRENIVLRNGFISGWGSGGVVVQINNGAIEGIHAHENSGWGISITGNNGIRIADCVASGNGFGFLNTGGIRVSNNAMIMGCIARENTGRGFFVERPASIANCVSVSNTTEGFQIDSNGALINCVARENLGNGFRLHSGSTITNSSANGNTLSGISASGQCLILGNNCHFNGRGNGGTDGAGIRAPSPENRIEENHCARNGRGIQVTQAANFIVRNTCVANMGLNFDFVASNYYGPIIDRRGIVTPAVSTSFAPSSLSSTDPWANFSM